MASSRMLALLGLLAVAGYQNRDRIKEMLGNVGQGNPGSVPGTRSQLRGRIPRLEAEDLAVCWEGSLAVASEKRCTAASPT